MSVFDCCKIILMVMSVINIKYIKGHEIPTVTTKLGTVRGVRAKDGHYSMYLGIPYAKVNKSNVFGDSIPDPSINLFDANDESKVCPQIDEFNNTIIGTLNCLNLNIYVPDSANRTLNGLPVMVYIHGGQFQFGFSGGFTYGPKYLIRHGVILVTMNYRLGPYGFMCLGTQEVSGNQGLKDQLKAIRWVKNNIEDFGGNKHELTVFGHSAGSMSLDLHLISSSERLYNKLIMQSGTALHPDVIKLSNPFALINIARFLNFDTSSTQEAITYLSNASEHDVINAASKLKNVFFPCIEKPFPNSETFLTNYPINLKIPKVEGISMLVGHTSDEEVFVYSAQELSEFVTSGKVFETSLVNVFDFPKNTLNDMVSIIRKMYTGDKKVGCLLDTNEYIAFGTDFNFVHPLQRRVKRYLENEAHKIYSYVFSYIGKRNFLSSKNNSTMDGVSHGDELGYLFDMEYLTDQPTSEDQIMIDRMTTMWTNFVKYDNPTPEITTLLPVKWKPITKNSPLNYLKINAELKSDVSFNHVRMSFWDLFFKANDNYQRFYGFVSSSSTSVLMNPFLVSALLCLKKFVY